MASAPTQLTGGGAVDQNAGAGRTLVFRRCSPSTSESTCATHAFCNRPETLLPRAPYAPESLIGSILSRKLARLSFGKIFPALKWREQRAVSGPARPDRLVNFSWSFLYTRPTLVGTTDAPNYLLESLGSRGERARSLIESPRAVAEIPAPLAVHAHPEQVLHALRDARIAHVHGRDGVSTPTALLAT